MVTLNDKNKLEKDSTMTNSITTTEQTQTAPITQFFNTLNLDSVAGKIAIVNATNGAESLSKHMDEVLQICDAFTMPAKRASRNGGEDEDVISVYLVDINGVAYFSQSVGVYNSLMRIYSIFRDMGKSLPEGYLPIYCKEGTTASGNTLKTLEIYQDAISEDVPANTEPVPF